MAVQPGADPGGLLLIPFSLGLDLALAGWLAKARWGTGLATVILFGLAILRRPRWPSRPMRMRVAPQAGELRVYHAGSLTLARLAVGLQPLAGSANDAEHGALPPAALSWEAPLRMMAAGR
ncbi:MAG: hypothetical protein IT318_01230 [Anaerolineales bacterium]|nr:hypothetical protein [Anaerolineales bacterium]